MKLLCSKRVKDKWLSFVVISNKIGLFVDDEFYGYVEPEQLAKIEDNIDDLKNAGIPL